MRVILTGASGQLGREWLDRAAEAGSDAFELHAFDSSRLDITRPDMFDEALSGLDADLWVNCAAYTAVDRAEDEPEAAMRVNARAPGAIARWCADRGVRLLHYSTDYVFPGLAEDRERYPGGYPEQARQAPVNVYGRSKAEGEKAVLDSGCDAVVARVSWLCGRHGGNFVKTIARLAAERAELRVVHDQIGCPAFCRDVVAQSLAILKTGWSGPIHLGSAGICSWHEFACEIAAGTGSDCRIVPVPSEDYPTKAVRPRYSKLDVSAFEAATGTLCPQWSLSLSNLLQDLKVDARG